MPASGIRLVPTEMARVAMVDLIGDCRVRLCLEQGSEYADEYVISLKPEDGGWVDTVQACEECMVLGDLQNGVVYHFKVHAVNQVGESDTSSRVCAVPTPRPVNLQGEPAHESISLWWHGNPVASGYKVYYSTSQSEPRQMWVDVGKDTSTVLTGLENEVLYYVFVVAYDCFGNETSPSNTISARPQCWAGSKGSEDVLATVRLGVCKPCPSGGLFIIPYELATDCREVRLVIYDALGREVRTLMEGSQCQGRYEVTWDGRDEGGLRVAPGIYFCRLEADTHSQSTRIVVLR